MTTGVIELMYSLRLLNRQVEADVSHQELHPGVSSGRIQRPCTVDLGERSVRVPSTIPAEEQPCAVDVGEAKLRLELQRPVELAPRLRKPFWVARVVVQSEVEIGRAQMGVRIGIVRVEDNCPLELRGRCFHILEALAFFDLREASKVRVIGLGVGGLAPPELRLLGMSEAGRQRR